MSTPNPSNDFAAESAYLDDWIDTFDRVYEDRPKVRPIEGAPDGHRQLVFPSIFPQRGLVGSSSHFENKPAMVEHLRALGYDWDEEGLVLTIPTPATFNARAAALPFDDIGYGLSYHVEDRKAFSTGPWLVAYYNGTIPIHAASRAFYDQFLSRGNRADSLYFHFASFVHDVSVHALNYHLIPRAVIRQLAERVRGAMSEFWDEWSSGELATAPAAMPYFLDNDLNRWSYEVWSLSQTPEEFVAIAGRDHNVEQLRKALDIRIQEAHIGVGDDDGIDDQAPSPFAPTEFRLTA